MRRVFLSPAPSPEREGEEAGCVCACVCVCVCVCVRAQACICALWGQREMIVVSTATRRILSRLESPQPVSRPKLSCCHHSNHYLGSSRSTTLDLCAVYFSVDMPCTHPNSDISSHRHTQKRKARTLCSRTHTHTHTHTHMHTHASCSVNRAPYIH